MVSFSDSAIGISSFDGSSLYLRVIHDSPWLLLLSYMYFTVHPWQCWHSKGGPQSCPEGGRQKTSAKFAPEYSPCEHVSCFVQARNTQFYVITNTITFMTLFVDD